MALLICDIVSPNLWGMILNRVQIFTDQISDQCPWTMDQVIDQDVAQVVPNGYVPSKGVIGEHKDNLKLYIDSKLNGSFNLWSYILKARIVGFKIPQNFFNFPQFFFAVNAKN